MQKVDDLTLSDYFGSEYTFEVYRKEVIVYPKYLEFDDVPGVYLFIRRGANQHGPWHKVLYVGQTEFLKQRLTYRHEKLYETIERGINITHICVHPTDNRHIIEIRLILKYDPPLNYKVG